MSVSITVSTEGLTTAEAETVAYLEYCMSKVDEKGMLARVVYDMIAFGKITPHEVGEILGVYDPDGITLDGEDDEEVAEAAEDATEEETPEPSDEGQ